MSDAPEEIIELAEADRVAAPLLLRMGNGCRAPDRAGLPYACSYRSASRDRDLIRDAELRPPMMQYFPILTLPATTVAPAMAVP